MGQWHRKQRSGGRAGQDGRVAESKSRQEGAVVQKGRGQKRKIGRLSRHLAIDSAQSKSKVIKGENIHDYQGTWPFT